MTDTITKIRVLADDFADSGRTYEGCDVARALNGFADRCEATNPTRSGESELRLAAGELVAAALQLKQRTRYETDGKAVEASRGRTTEACRRVTAALSTESSEEGSAEPEQPQESEGPYTFHINSEKTGWRVYADFGETGGFVAACRKKVEARVLAEALNAAHKEGKKAGLAERSEPEPKERFYMAQCPDGFDVWDSSPDCTSTYVACFRGDDAEADANAFTDLKNALATSEGESNG